MVKNIHSECECEFRIGRGRREELFVKTAEKGVKIKSGLFVNIYLFLGLSDICLHLANLVFNLRPRCRLLEIEAVFGAGFISVLNNKK